MKIFLICFVGQSNYTTGIGESWVCLPCNLTLVDFQASLRHVAHALLTLFTAVHGEIMDVWSLVCHLKVSDAAVTLSNHIHCLTYNFRNKQLYMIVKLVLVPCLAAKVDYTSVRVKER